MTQDEKEGTGQAILCLRDRGKNISDFKNIGKSPKV
jgi:hypothetical protein